MILYSMSIMLSFMFMYMNHPMTMGLTLLMQTILIALITGLLNMNFWFSYILFLIMIGGMLVLFIYMTSIASNEMFSYSNNMLFLIFFMSSLFFLLSIIMDFFFINLNFKYKENILIMNDSYMMLIKYFSYPSIMIIMFMINYLLITMIAIVKITKIEYGPLRQKF